MKGKRMWIFLNDGFFSIVQNDQNKDELLVRSRYKGDIERVFQVDDVIENDESDYRFRKFLPRTMVAEILANEVINEINYTNFKNSVDDDGRHSDYSRVWAVLYNSQEDRHPRKYNWAASYKYKGNKKSM